MVVVVVVLTTTAVVGFVAGLAAVAAAVAVSIGTEWFLPTAIAALICSNSGGGDGAGSGAFSACTVSKVLNVLWPIASIRKIKKKIILQDKYCIH